MGCSEGGGVMLRLKILIELVEHNIESAEHEVRAVATRLRRMGDDAIAFANGKSSHPGAVSDQGDLAYWTTKLREQREFLSLLRNLPGGPDA